MATEQAKKITNVCLIVIDGWGLSEATHGNAIKNADTPVMDELMKGECLTLDASGLAVGLPEGLMGNSEVGHFTIGTGRVTYQDIVAINLAIKNKTFHVKPILLEAFERAKSKNGRVHFLGLVSDGGVHSHITHLEALLEAAKQAQVPQAFVHFFSDGRDTSPTSGVTYVDNLCTFISTLGYGKMATLMGRYYAMDRDKRYERTKIAFEGITQGKGEEVSIGDLVKKMQERYNAEGDAKQTDEFMKPVILEREGLVKDQDTMIFIDFRADRMRQIVEAFGIKPQFDTEVIPKDIGLFSMTEYKKEFPFPILFPPEIPHNSIAEWLSKKNIRQFHCAETEKYAHVTFFFNGGIEKPFEGEERCLVPSPKVATYDLQPEMSAAGVGEAMVDAINSGKFPFVMCNFAPPDMVGHTGQYKPAVDACAATDVAIGAIQRACEEKGYVLLVTADHGNAERMIDEDGKPVTKHTTFRENGLATVEEFHQEIQMVTNYPLKDFVIPFLKENLVYFQEELKVTAEALSTILGSAPNPETPVTAPEYVEPELVIVPSTKPSAPPTTTTVTSAPSSPLSILSNDRNLSNLPSMSAPPATIHEPPAIAPTRIETVPNASAVRKRPRDLFMDGNDTGHEGRGHSQGYGPKRPRPIPTATLTPTQGQLHHQQQQQPPPQQQQQPPPPPHINEPRPSHIYSQSHSTSYVPVSRAVTATTHVQYSHSRPSSAGSTGTPQREISPVIVTSTSSNPLVHQRMLTQIKDDWAHLETMMMTIEGMVSKSQKSFQTLKERVQQVVTMTSSLQYRQFELEHEQVVQQRIEQALEESNLQAAEEKQKILVDASRQMRDAIREANVQTNSKESCWNCGRKATETCSGCNKARYCGTFCQHKDWDKHMKQCAGSRSNREKERTMTVSHATRTTPLNHASTNAPTVNSHHHIPNSHSHITMATPSSRIIKSNRAPTPTSYIGSELFVPLRTDPLANGNGTLTATSNGVAVVTISRTAGDMTTTGGTLI